MSNDRDNDDWSNDSASLFREARRAHDPTLVESGRLTAVLARIRAGKAEASFAAIRGADIVARGATSELLRPIAMVSLGVVCIAAASYAWIRFNRSAPEPTRSAKPAPAAIASTPPPAIAPPVMIAPPQRAGEKPVLEPPQRAGAKPVLEPPQRAGEKPVLAAAQVQARARSQRRRARAFAETQPTTRSEVASVAEASTGSAPSDSFTTAPVPDNSTTRHERAEPGSAPRATSFASKPEQPAAPAVARNADPKPEQALTELATMKRIQAALRDTDFSTVLALCAEHARRWPHGVFELEREGARAIASCGENSDDAPLRAKRFLSAHPHAPVAMRVNAACAALLKKR